MASPVFLIPELLSEILEQVDCVERGPYWRPEERKCPRSLLRCQLVNSLWFNEATPIIWRVLPNFCIFEAVKDGHRRQQYVKMVRELYLYGRMIPGAFEFTRLKTVRIVRGSKEHNLDGVLSLLMPTVEHFQFSSRAEINCFESLERRCPNIQSLCLQLDSVWQQEKSFTRYLAVTTARRVEIQGCYAKKLLPVLAQNDNIREVINLRIGSDDILCIKQSGIKQPFKNLKYFSFDHGWNMSLPDLLCFVPNVEHLVIDKLSLYGQPAPLNVLLELASPNLKRIFMRAGSRAEKSRLLAMAMRFPLLESVQLYSDTYTPDASDHDTSEMLDDEFAHEFTRRLPNLKVIELEFDHESLTAEGLISIGRNCPLLEVLDLVCDYAGNHTGNWGKTKWHRRSLFNCPMFLAEKEPLFPRLVYFAPLVKMKHLPRWMQKYHFPIIFGELERKFGVTKDNSSCRAWFIKIRTRLLAEYKNQSR